MKKFLLFFKFLLLFILMCFCFFKIYRVNATPVNTVLYGIRRFKRPFNSAIFSTSFVTTSTPLPVMIVSEPTGSSSYVLEGVSLSMVSPVQKTGISYDISLTFRISFSGLQNTITPETINNLQYSLNFEQGAIIQESKSIQLLSYSVDNIGDGINTALVRVRNSVNLNVPINLTTIALGVDGGLGLCDNVGSFLPCGKSVNAQLKAVDVSVSISQDPNTAILGSIDQSLQDLNDSINDTNDSINNLNDSMNDTNESVKDTNDTLKDDSVSSASDTIDEVSDSIATNGVITQLVTLPITLYQNILNSVNGACSSYNLGSLYGTDIILPCISISNYLGSNLWSVIDVLISGLLVWSISRKMIKVFDNFSSMKDGDVLSD